MSAVVIKYLTNLCHKEVLSSFLYSSSPGTALLQLNSAARQLCRSWHQQIYFSLFLLLCFSSIQTGSQLTYQNTSAAHLFQLCKPKCFQRSCLPFSVASIRGTEFAHASSCKVLSKTILLAFFMYLHFSLLPGLDPLLLLLGFCKHLCMRIAASNKSCWSLKNQAMALHELLFKQLSQAGTLSCAFTARGSAEPAQGCWQTQSFKHPYI